MIKEASTRTFVDNTNEIIAQRFIKLQMLYSNGTHDIVKVHDRILDKVSVLKIIKDNSFRDLLEEEFKILINLNHVNIIRGYEIYNYDDLYFYSMEYIEEKFLKNKIVKYTEMILDAFNYIHLRGIVHNDIKLNNFIFGSDKVFLIDFSKAVKNADDILKNKEKFILSRFLIQWINYNLNLDFIGDTYRAQKYIGGRLYKKIIDMFYGNF